MHENMYMYFNDMAELELYEKIIMDREGNI